MNLIKTKSFDLAIYAKGDEKARKFALVLPGRLDTKDYPHMKSHVEFLANRDYLAISFDPPGTWESPGDIKIYTMSNYLKAINELVEYFGNRPTLVFGHSRGGSMALLAAIKNPFVTGFASAMGGYSYAPGVYKGLPGEEIWKLNGYKVEKRDVPNSDETRIFNLPYAFIEDSSQYDMLEDLRKCIKPKLFIFGARDTTVKPEVVKKAYEEAALPKEIFSLDCDHNYRRDGNLINTVNNELGKFLDKYEQ